VTEANRTEDLRTFIAQVDDHFKTAANGSYVKAPYPLYEGHWEKVRAKIEWLQEVVTIPLITPESPPGLYMRVLSEHEKGQPVNAQDLINALMWRVKNQRRELSLLQRRVEECRSND
jgi:hypothetical protein